MRVFAEYTTLNSTSRRMGKTRLQMSSLVGVRPKSLSAGKVEGAVVYGKRGSKCFLRTEDKTIPLVEEYEVKYSPIPYVSFNTIQSATFSL